MVIFTFLYNSTYYAWSGDVCFGPRHLVVALPFIILPTVYCSLKYIKLFGCLSIFISLAGVSTIPSDNLLTNILMFIYRGLFLHWLDFAYKNVLPKYFNINLSLVTPFFLYVGIGLIFYMIWKPELTNMNYKHRNPEWIQRIATYRAFLNKSRLDKEVGISQLQIHSSSTQNNSHFSQ